MTMNGSAEKQRMIFVDGHDIGMARDRPERAERTVGSEPVPRCAPVRSTTATALVCKGRGY